MTDIREKIENTITDLVANFLYYDRKEDEELPRGAIEAAVEAGDVSIYEIYIWFAEALREGLKA